MHAHLLPYPILVEDSGDVKPLPGFELFADTQAKIMGQRSNAIPDALTT
jgi:phospholipase D1/2